MKRLSFEVGETIKDSGLLFVSDSKSEGKRRVNVKCVCGTVFDIFLDSLTKKSPTKSCGCLTGSILKAQKTKHGLCGSEMYKRWCGMKSRCYNKNDKRYADWGGRGITICDEWLYDFESFNKWALKNGGFDGIRLQIDRMDNDKGYSPDNCRFVTCQINNRNRGVRSNNKTGITGVSIDSRDGKYSSFISLDNKEVKIIGYFLDFFEACCARKSAENKYW